MTFQTYKCKNLLWSFKYVSIKIERWMIVAISTSKGISLNYFTISLDLHLHYFSSLCVI